MEFAAQTKPPDSDIRADELQQKLFHLVSALPQRQADAFVLSRIEGLEYHEIAKMMSCSVETVRVHVHRALKSLANNLADYFPKRTVD
jgi:RNA polymerase sigma-70 factor (ECF subfamily)